MKDLYTLSAPGSAPVAIIAKLVVGGSCSAQSCQLGSAFLSWKLAMPGGPSGNASAGTCTFLSVHDSLSVPITVVPGVPFEIDVTFQASGFYGNASGGASLSFESLPPAGAITSCQGFTIAPPVATRSRSWGGTKLLYR